MITGGGTTPENTHTQKQTNTTNGKDQPPRTKRRRPASRTNEYTQQTTTPAPSSRYPRSLRKDDTTTRHSPPRKGKKDRPTKSHQTALVEVVGLRVPLPAPAPLSLLRRLPKLSVLKLSPGPTREKRFCAKKTPLLKLATLDCCQYTVGQVISFSALPYSTPSSQQKNVPRLATPTPPKQLDNSARAISPPLKPAPTANNHKDRLLAAPSQAHDAIHVRSEAEAYSTKGTGKRAESLPPPMPTKKSKTPKGPEKYLFQQIEHQGNRVARTRKKFRRSRQAGRQDTHTTPKKESKTTL